jgi:uncharacterized protein (DUF302 family)
MNIQKVNVERIDITSSRPFDAVTGALEAEVGRPDLAKYTKEIEGAPTLAEMENAVQKAVGAAGLMMFLRLDLGAILRKETGLASPKIMRYLIGNPLIMRDMARHTPEVGSYAPVTILVDERRDGVHLSYDRMASLLRPYQNADALQVARDLDSKVETLLAKISA